MKEFLADDLLANLGVGMMSLSSSSFPAASLPVPSCTGMFPVAPESQELSIPVYGVEADADGPAKTFPDIHCGFHISGCKF